MRGILFDTDVLVESLRGNERVNQALVELVQKETLIACTPISFAEIYRGIRSHEKEKTALTLSVFTCVALDDVVGKRAGEYMKSYGKTHGVELADALIAACAVVHRMNLCTFNWKHYPMGDLNRYPMER